METVHRDILQELRQKIVDDLDVNNIIRSLTEKRVLLNDNLMNIQRAPSKERRAQILLDILPSCGPHAFDIFHQSLRYHYSWLSDDIDSSLRRRGYDVIDTGRNTSRSPNLPPQPTKTVNREAKMEELKNALTKLQSGSYLVLHGMKGFGKSCLTANTLKDRTLTRNLFTDQVYWIKFGYERTIEDEILIQLNFLYHLVRNVDSLNSSMNSEPLKQNLIHYLHNYFANPNNCDALLILDDVWDKEIIAAFDFPCKTLVITTDSDLLEGKERQIIEMKKGFTQKETLGLFAKSLKIEVDKLPPEAKMIHEECNGMPILIAMFAAQFEEFKDEMTRNTEKWRYYLRSLRNKDPSNRLVMKFLEKQAVIFDTCIGQLDQEIREKYEALVIFSEDVNIMPQTLQILWDLDASDDPDIQHKIAEDMLILCHKSLAAMLWNQDLDSYVYGVHDLLLCHLRRKLTANELRELHRSFIEKYRKYCKGDFSKMPHDNYSYSYIGHHLEQSGLYDEFPKLYLDFDFLREKIYHTGLSDVLIDLKKYRSYITKNTEEGKARVEDLETFLENQAGVIAEHRRRKCLDLVQIGINYSNTGYIYEKCLELATLKTSNLYVTHDHLNMLNNKPISTEVFTVVKTAYFTHDWNKILIGNKSGEVILWDCDTKHQKIFSGHDKKTAIVKIIHIDDENFLTLGEDGKVKLFVIRNTEHGNGLARRESRRIQSPREKQSFWSSIYGDTNSKDNSEMTFSIDGEMITDMTLSGNTNNEKRVAICTAKETTQHRRLAICTAEGTAQVLTLGGKILYNEKHKENFGHVAFTREGDMLHLLSTEGVLIYYVMQGNQPYSYLSMYNTKLENRKVLLFQAVPRSPQSLLIVTETAAIIIKWHESCDNNYPNWAGLVCNFIRQERANIEENDCVYTCSAVTHDGKCFVTGDTKGSIKVWSIDASFQPVVTFKGRVNSLDTYCFEDGYHLICGGEDRVIHQWELATEELPTSHRKPLVDAVVKPFGQSDFIAKEIGNKIVISNGENASQTEPVIGNITHFSLNSDGTKLVYAIAETCSVAIFDTENGAWPIMPYKINGDIDFVSFININKMSIAACGEHEHLHLFFYNVTSVLEKVGSVLSVHTIDDDNAMTISRNGFVNFWIVAGPCNWKFINQFNACSKNEELDHSCLSPNSKLLALRKKSGEITIYDIIKEESVESTRYDADIITKIEFDQKISCCEFSKDNDYLAVGLQNGDISIFDVYGRCELSRLQLHCKEIHQLHWGPISLGVPILFSVNCDEFAWWNVASILSLKQVNTRSRMGISRSTNNIGWSPRSSGRLNGSKSLDLKSSGALSRELQLLGSQSSNTDLILEQKINENNSNGRSDYWKKKSARDEKKLTLLTVVPLPPNFCNSKVWVSEDFRKFLSVDSHGHASNFRLFNDT